MNAVSYPLLTLVESVFSWSDGLYQVRDLNCWSCNWDTNATTYLNCEPAYSTPILNAIAAPLDIPIIETSAVPYTLRTFVYFSNCTIRSDKNWKSGASLSSTIFHRLLYPVGAIKICPGK